MIIVGDEEIIPKAYWMMKKQLCTNYISQMQLLPLTTQDLPARDVRSVRLAGTKIAISLIPRSSTCAPLENLERMNRQCSREMRGISTAQLHVRVK